MGTFEMALKADKTRSAGDACGVMACERVMRLLVKFLDEVDRPHGMPSYGRLHHPFDEANLKVSAWLLTAEVFLLILWGGGCLGFHLQSFCGGSWLGLVLEAGRMVVNVHKYMHVY